MSSILRMAGLLASALASDTALGTTPAQVAVEARVAPVLTIGGLRFKDLNRNGKLDAYEDWRLPAERRAADLIARMTLPEKAGLMMHAAHSGYFGPGGAVLDTLAPPPPGALKPPVNIAGVPGFDRADKPSPRDIILNRNVRWLNTSPGGTPADAARWANGIQEIAEGSRLGIPVMLTADPVHTTNRLPGGALPPPDRLKITSSWPDQIGLAAIGDAAVVERFGQIAATEYHALGYRMIINPMADLATEPRWNRIAGTFGESADLSAKLVSAYIKGVQGAKVGRDSVLAVVKHFPGDGPVENGFDPHNPYGKRLVYPAGMQAYHLKPFRAAFDAGVSSVMGSYGIPTGIDTVGANFSKRVIAGMLRQKMGFDGIVITDWLHAQPWGVEALSKQDRELKLIQAGVDQFGGEHETSYIIALAKAGKVSTARIDQSMRRILVPMFKLGIFEDPYVDPARATQMVKSPEFVAAGDDAQRRAIVLLKDAHNVLPLRPDAKLGLVGFDQPPAALAGRVASSPGAAEVMIVKVNAPFALNKSGQSFFTKTHEGMPIYAGADNAGDLTAIRAAVATGKPVVVVMSMERPAILSEFIASVDGMVATFGSDDAAVADILIGRVAPSGKLPFALPADAASVEAQKEDAPGDFARTLFPMGFGLSYPSPGPQFR